MGMTRRSRTHKRPVVNAAPRSDVAQSVTSAETPGGFTALWERAAQEILAVTYWFDPAPHQKPYPVTVRFSGRRVDVQGRMQAGDRFVQDETIEKVVPGSGPISLTTRVRGINPGEWAVTARVQGSDHPERKPREQGNTTLAVGPLRPAVRFWRRWAHSAGSAEHLRTCPTPLAHVPGSFPAFGERW